MSKMTTFKAVNDIEELGFAINDLEHGDGSTIIITKGFAQQLDDIVLAFVMLKDQLQDALEKNKEDHLTAYE